VLLVHRASVMTHNAHENRRGSPRPAP
jgi:hypothetical protein